MLSIHKEQDIRDARRQIVPIINGGETVSSSGYMTALLFYGIDLTGDGAYYAICLPQELGKVDREEFMSNFFKMTDVLFEEKPVALTDIQFYSRYGNGVLGVRIINSSQSFNSSLIETFFRAQNFRFD